MNDQSERGLVITASEVGQYAFCARGWWLGRVQGCPTTHVQEMVEGQFAHEVHARVVAHCERLLRLAQLLIILATLVGAWGLYLWVRGL